MQARFKPIAPGASVPKVKEDLARITALTELFVAQAPPKATVPAASVAVTSKLKVNTP
jgi:hypothetical protein